MDEEVTHSAQMEEKASPVILINKFNVKSEDVNQLLKAWAANAAYFKQQPGFISTQLHRGIGGSCVFVNYATWESADFFKRSLNNSEFKSKILYISFRITLFMRVSDRSILKLKRSESFNYFM